MNVILITALFLFGIIGIFVGILALDYSEREESCNEQKIELTRFHEFNNATKNWVKLSWGLEKCYEFYPEVNLSRYK